MNNSNDTVLKSIQELPLQFTDSWKESQKINLPEEYKNVKNIVVSGMGGSRFPTLILSELFKEELKVPLVINSEYRLPGFVDENTLLIASSYSGTTEETLANVKSAKEKNAKILGVTMGGELQEYLQKNNYPAYIFNPTHNPSGQPRMGFGYNFGGILGLLYSLDLIKIDAAKIESAFSNLSNLIPSLEEPAKKMANDLYEKYPTIVVSEFLSGCGNAMANQTNETAKANSNFRIIPELNHHLLEGLKYPKELKNFDVFLFFFSRLYSERIQKRFLITREVVEQNNLKTIWYEMKSEDKISQVLEFLALSSFMTMFLCNLYGEDPTSIPFVDYFKKRLKE